MTNMDKDTIRKYVVMNAKVNKPGCYKGDWNVMLTLGSDINEHAATIEKAYQKMTDRIHISTDLQKFMHQ